MTALVGASVLTAGCGSRPVELDINAVERAIAESLLAEHHVYATVGCPPKVPRRPGFVFACTANLAVGRYPITVTETDGNGQVKWASAEPLVLLNRSSIIASITRSIWVQRHLRARVTCPDEVLQQQGIAFTCLAEIDGRSYRFRVTEIDDHGHVTYVGR